MLETSGAWSRGRTLPLWRPVHLGWHQHGIRDCVVHGLQAYLSRGANIWEDGAGWLVDGLTEKRLSACSQILGDHSTKVFNFIASIPNDNWNLSRDGYKASKMEGDYAESIKRVIMVNFWILINFPPGFRPDQSMEKRARLVQRLLWGRGLKWIKSS